MWMWYLTGDTLEQATRLGVYIHAGLTLTVGLICGALYTPVERKINTLVKRSVDALTGTEAQKLLA